MARRLGSREVFQVGRQVQPERGPLPFTPQRQFDQAGQGRRPQRGDLERQLGEADQARFAVRPGRLARPRRPLRLVHRHGLAGERPDGAVQRIDRVDAQVEAFLGWRGK